MTSLYCAPGRRKKATPLPSGDQAGSLSLSTPGEPGDVILTSHRFPQSCGLRVGDEGDAVWSATRQGCRFSRGFEKQFRLGVSPDGLGSRRATR